MPVTLSRMPEAAPGRLLVRQTMTTARIPYASLHHTTRGTALLAEIGEHSPGCSSRPGKRDVAAGAIVGGK